VTPSPANVRKIFSPFELGVDLLCASLQIIWNQIVAGKFFHSGELTGGGSLFSAGLAGFAASCGSNCVDVL
jgi:hypothetical protein